MRLNCPSCGAEYEVSDGMIPSAGRHVQCTACHTRWFVRGVPGTGLTEDQILRRLETWSPAPSRPMPAPVPTPAAADAPEEAPPPPGDALPADPPVADPTVPDPAPTEPTAPDPSVVVQLQPRKAPPAKPAERPAVAQPAPVSAPAPRPEPAARSPERLDLGERAPAPAAPRPSRSHFARGLVLALVLAALGLGAYLYRAPIAAQLPAARPALAAYGEAIDRWRAALEERLAPLRGPAPSDRG